MNMFKSAAVLLAALLIAGTGFAQPAPDYATDAQGYSDEGDASSPAVDPPTRVARLSLIQGAVSFVPAGEDSWVQAEVNRPLISGDKLWTDNGARAELQIGAATIRVNAQSSFNFLNLDDNMAQIELTQGTLNLRVRRIYDGQTYEVDTPTLAFVINRVGEYRIDISPDGNGTMVTAFHGGGDAYGEAGARFRIEEGQSVRFNDPRLSDYVSNPVPSPDDFDRFCFERNGRWDNSRSRQFVSEDVIGYDDLDTNGNWDNSPDYGVVWYPNQVDVGWTPYSYGHWAWVGVYGWTWVDSSPWGFAPFHYGRWAWINNRWGWCPGPAHVRPYYAPALVAFVGAGGARLAFGAGGPVGWFPLGPRDVYVPSYRVSRNYFTNVNIHNTTINNVTINNFYGGYQRGNLDYGRINYANRNVANAITAVRGDVFVNSRQVRGAAVAVNRENFANARVAGFAAIAPTRASLAFDGGARRGSAPPQSVQARNIIAATRPPAPMASFAQREAQLQRNPGRALPVTQLRAAPSVIGNGAQAQHAALAARPNINVVTREGIPARSLAPTVQSRTDPVQTESRVVTGNGPQVDRSRVDNRGIDARRTLDNSTRLQNEQVLRGNPTPQANTIQGRNVVVPPTVHAPANEQRTLPSSRYVNPNAADNGGQQRSLRNGTPEFRSNQIEHAPPANLQQQRTQQEMQLRRPQEIQQMQRAPVQVQRETQEFKPRQQVQPQQFQQHAVEAPRIQPQQNVPQAHSEESKSRTRVKHDDNDRNHR
ncbi:MAG: hypothetical protein QM741_11515 [Rudaea sp.]|uniref:DUF6600 domain-containing protein n=1 Tax=Rudaea sp. TaxID=2136325 RepID=UPI0039E3CCF3